MPLRRVRLDFGWRAAASKKAVRWRGPAVTGDCPRNYLAPRGVERLSPRPNHDWPRYSLLRRSCQPKNHVAIPFARFAERTEPVDERRIEPDLNLSVWAFGRRRLVDPGRVRLEGLIGLLGDRYADHAASLSRRRPARQTGRAFSPACPRRRPQTLAAPAKFCRCR
jgi:hypothetical protein